MLKFIVWVKQNGKLKEECRELFFAPRLAFEAKRIYNWSWKFWVCVVRRVSFSFFFNLKLLNEWLLSGTRFNRAWQNNEKCITDCNPVKCYVPYTMCVYRVKGFAFFLSFRLSVSREKEINFFPRKFSPITLGAHFFHPLTKEHKKTINFIGINEKMVASKMKNVTRDVYQKTECVCIEDSRKSGRHSK